MVSFPDDATKTKASASLKNQIKDIKVKDPRKLAPKLMIVGLPLDFEQSNFTEAMCEKDPNLKKMIDEGCTIQTIGCWDVIDNSGQLKSKRNALKVPPCGTEYTIYCTSLNTITAVGTITLPKNVLIKIKNPFVVDVDSRTKTRSLQ